VSGSPLASTSGASFTGIAAHPSGSFLYATDSTCVDGGSSNRLYGYVIDPSTGALTAIGGSPFTLPGSSGCYYDEDVAAEASGNFVYTVDANDGVAAYKVNSQTGALTLASSSFTGPRRSHTGHGSQRYLLNSDLDWSADRSSHCTDRYQYAGQAVPVHPEGHFQ